MVLSNDATSLASSLSTLRIDPQVASQVFESQELVEVLLAVLWHTDVEPGGHTVEEWPKLPQLCRATQRICDSIGRRRMTAYGLTDDMRRHQESPLRTLADTAEIYLLGGSGQLQMACRVVSGVWRLEALSPMPTAAHGYEISAAAVGRFVFVTSDVEHHLGARQQWEYRDAASPQMPEGRAHIARLDVATGTWTRITTPAPRDDEQLPRACAVSGCLGTLRGALFHTGGSRECLHRHPDHAHNAARRRYTRGAHVLWRAPQPNDGTHGVGCPGDGESGDAWEALQPMLLERCNHSLCEYAGHLYAAGGCPPTVTVQSVETYEHFFGASGGRYDLSVERFGGRSWELVAPVPWEQQDANACSLQLVVCAGQLHALLIGFDAFLDHGDGGGDDGSDDGGDGGGGGGGVGGEGGEGGGGEGHGGEGGDEDGWGEGGARGGATSVRGSDTFALFRYNGDSWPQWTRCWPGGEQPQVSLLGSPLVAHGRRITIFGATSDGRPCAHTLECSSVACTRPTGGQLQPNLVDARYRWLPASELSGCVPGVACPSEWTAGVALPVALT